MDDGITELRENVVLVELPNELVLVPVVAARDGGYHDDQFLEEYPIRGNMKAGIR